MAAFLPGTRSQHEPEGGASSGLPSHPTHILCTRVNISSDDDRGRKGGSVQLVIPYIKRSLEVNTSKSLQFSTKWNLKPSLQTNPTAYVSTELYLVLLIPK